MESKDTFQLIYENNKLVLVAADEDFLPICVDFESPEIQHRLKTSKGMKEPLAKAVGAKGHYRPTVVDGTAGFGTDAFMLASLGCEVLMVERSSTVAALLADGLKRIAHLNMPLHYLQEDTLVYLNDLEAKDYPDVIYLDPMFPPKNKTAKVKKEMQILQAIANETQDEQALLLAARPKATKRVVVKRPKWADPIAPPHIQYPTKNYRFDVYLSE